MSQKIIKPIKKAVFPVAGLGTRFLPVTKANPKEMLPIVDKPLIQFAVEEALAIGVEQLIFITSTGKRSIEDYFDTHYELEAKLEERQKQTIEECKKRLEVSEKYLESCPKMLEQWIETNGEWRMEND